jgi:hypothetical protein
MFRVMIGFAVARYSAGAIGMRASAAIELVVMEGSKLRFKVECRDQRDDRRPLPFQAGSEAGPVILSLLAGGRRRAFTPGFARSATAAARAAAGGGAGRGLFAAAIVVAVGPAVLKEAAETGHLPIGIGSILALGDVAPGEAGRARQNDGHAYGPARGVL